MGDWQAEAAFAEFQTRKQAIADVSNRDNEAVTRLRAIDTLLFDVLRWDKSYVETEKYCRAEGYADYVFEIDGRPLLVLEAKRAGTSFVIANASFEGHPYVFQLLAKESPSAMDALRQALGYAATLGSTYIAISNGHQWLFTLTFVPEESLQERHIYVFESLEAIEKRFRLFWNCFSADGIQRNIVSDHLLQSRRVPAPAKFSTRIAGYPHKADRNVFRNELSYILDLVWQIVAQGEASQDFVTNCYVSPNSHADVIGLARELLERRRHEDDVLVQFDIKSIDQLPHQVAQLPAERPFVVLGEVGRGKSSFLKYLRLVAARDSLKNYIQIDIDFLDRPDSAEEVPDFIYGEIERQLREKYHVDIYEDGFVRGVLHGELTRLRKTPKGKLYEGDEKRYREFEVDHIDSVVKNRHSYFTMVMHHLKRGRRCSLAIFFDNLDRRVEPLQEAAFLKCSAMARDWCSLVFVCLRPTTFYKSQQSGVLDAIAPKTFTVSQPDLALVLKKRFTYARAIAMGEKGAVVTSPGVSSKRISFDLPRVAQLLESCVFAARKGHGIIPMLEAVSNGNIRRLLDLAKAILTSNHLDTQKILNYIESDGRYVVPDYEGVKTLLYGDYMHYDPLKSVFINLFDIRHSDPKEHFLRYIILRHLTRFFGDSENRGYVRVHSIRQYLAHLGYCRMDVDDALRYLHQMKCVRASVEADEWSDAIEQLRVTSLGRYHVNYLVATFQYIDAMVFDTPIIDDEYRSSLNERTDITTRVARTKRMLDYLDAAVGSVSDASVAANWQQVAKAARIEIAEVEAAIAR